MIELRKTGSIFTTGAQAIVNCVNTVGVMGAGLALEFKKKYPQMFADYAYKCKEGKIKIGQMDIWQYTCEFDWQDYGYPMYIINFPTKEHWKNSSKLEWIATGLDDLRNHAIIMEMVSIALPALGCGYGGLQYDDVQALVEEKLGDLSTTIILFEPQ